MHLGTNPEMVALPEAPTVQVEVVLPVAQLHV